MADDQASPRPFRRERNLSNRNFNKRGSNRQRFSAESHNSSDAIVFNHTNAINTDAIKISKSTEDTDSSCSTSVTTPSQSLNTTSSSMDISYSVHTDTENAFNQKSLLKMRSTETDLKENQTNQKLQRQAPTSPQSPDPALLDVKQKLLLFENLQADERIIFKTCKFKSKSSQSLLLPNEGANSLSASATPSYMAKVYPLEMAINNTAQHASIDEERSEDEVESLKDELNETTLDDFGGSNSRDERQTKGSITTPLSAINQSFLTPFLQHSKSHSEDTNKDKLDSDCKVAQPTLLQPRHKEFSRNYRSRPKTEVLDASCEPHLNETGRFLSLHHRPKKSEPDDEEQIELRDKSFSCVQPILEELIKTEESYVENLWIGINNYGNIFQRKDLPIGLRGKKYVLFGNVEQIAEFHRDEFLPMLQRNKHDLKRIFDEFREFIDNNYFYGYVLFTMNKQRSLKLCDLYKNYFKLLQSEIDDKLGINSFLVQPIQRMARYPLLLQQFITTLFKNRDYVLKPIIESCCRLEKKLRNLLITTNESEIINDIVCVCDAHEFNTFYQGKFRKVSEFHVFDHSLKRSYRSKVFMFDKCIIYTEIKGKQLIFHGRYPCEHIGITAKTKQFTLYYDQRKMQECDFMADQALIDQWLDLIREMITAYAAEERKKLKELHSSEFGGDHIHRKPANLSLFRDSNRFSSDSGIGNIWVVPKPEQEEAASNRTTWYAVS